MSKIPTFICIDEEEFEILKKSHKELVLSKNIHKNSLEEIDKNLEFDINYKLEKIEKRQIELQKFNYELNGEIRRAETQLLNRIDEQNKKIRFLREEYLELFKNEKEQYTNLFFNHSKKLLEEIDKFLKKDLISDLVIFKKQDKKKERVLEILNNLKTLSKSIKLLPHSKFFPNKYEYARSLLSEIKEDFDAEFYESAFSNARNCYKILLELEEQTLKKEQESIYLGYILNKNLKYLKEILNKTIFIDNINLIPETFNKINRWVKNIENLVTEKDFISIEELKSLINKSEIYIKKYSKDFEEEIIKSIKLIIRLNISDYLIKILYYFFYQVNDKYFLDNNYNKALILIMENKLSEKLSISIENDKMDFLNYKIKIDSENEDITLKLVYELLSDFKLNNI